MAGDKQGRVMAPEAMAHSCSLCYRSSEMWSLRLRHPTGDQGSTALVTVAVILRGLSGPCTGVQVATIAASPRWWHPKARESGSLGYWDCTIFIALNPGAVQKWQWLCYQCVLWSRKFKISTNSEGFLLCCCSKWATLGFILYPSKCTDRWLLFCAPYLQIICNFTSELFIPPLLYISFSTHFLFVPAVSIHVVCVILFLHIQVPH